jgi:hypothetical protein
LPRQLAQARTAGGCSPERQTSGVDTSLSTFGSEVDGHRGTVHGGEHRFGHDRDAGAEATHATIA